MVVSAPARNRHRGGTLDERAHQLIGSIYAATNEPERWQAVVDSVSELFSGSAVAFGVLVPPGEQPIRYACGVPKETLPQLLEHLLAETRWSNQQLVQHEDRFGNIAEGFDDVEISSLKLYRDFMKRLDLAPIWPVGHSIAVAPGRPAAGIVVLRKDGQGPFEKSELARADRLVPHLRRAVTIRGMLRAASQEQRALSEAVDRLPIGILLLDPRGQVVMLNRRAEQILTQDDGLRLGPGGVTARDRNANTRIQELIARATQRDTSPESQVFAMAQRPSGRRDYTLAVRALSDARFVGGPSEVVAVLFIVDPESGPASSPEVLTTLYNLTHSEAELTQLLARGLSLEEAASRRGVSLNTARSHLKHVFAKTGTTRQSQLLRLIVAGVGSMETDEE